MSDGAESNTGLWVGLALGAPVMAYGVRGALVDAPLTHPGALAAWVVGSALAHDLVLAPAVLALGWAARRVTPRPAWPAVRWGLFTTGTLALLAWPLVRGYGRNPNVPSLLPRDYGTGFVVFTGAVWLAVAAWSALAWWRPRHRTSTSARSTGRPGTP